MTLRYINLRLTLTLILTSTRVTWATSVPILVFLGLSVLDLGPMYATDRQTSDAHHRLIPLLYRRGHNNNYLSLFQPYERMNVADAFVTQHYNDGDVIIQQVRPSLRADYMGVTQALSDAQYCIEE